jgi:tRNA nucleotidyltransferase (CCA-adding enzyme)
MNHPKLLTVITTHVNADFDALASMLAAQKLYPGALVIFPSAPEKNIKNFFINSIGYLLNMTDINTINLTDVRRLVLVDTNQSGRIGKFADLLKKPDVEIHIYDHHPASAGDIKAHHAVCRSTGATVTILLDLIKEQGIDISADEATIMGLGIYEDTGSFTYPSTTTHDFKAAAYLLSKGANLVTLTNLISREFRSDEIKLLNDMIRSVRRIHINGAEIALTRITRNDYVPDFAFLVQKMIKIERLDAIFAIALMGSKIYIIARSQIPQVDVGKILKVLGGGGHTYAAAVSIKNRTLAQTENKLVNILYQKVKPKIIASKLMSAPPITSDADVTCCQAAELMTRSNINALLVTEKTDKRNQPEKLLGYITRQVIDKALYLKLGDQPVREYTNTESVSVEPDAALSEIRDKIIENKQRVLPVVVRDKTGQKIIGVITRTDLLNVLASDTKQAARDMHPTLNGSVNARTKNITNFMRERLSPEMFRLLKHLGQVADQIRCNCFLVGGFVRDLLLYRPNQDIDIVIEGDGIEFARQYARLAGARVHAHNKFKTAVIIFPDNFKIDIASARVEYYQFPAALPTVEMSSIKQDLYRRDFTINTLIIQLNSDHFGRLIDFYSAQKDIKAKAIRVLHNMSLVEDPTRVFRAIRFEKRFDFEIGKLTHGLIKNAVKKNFFKDLSGGRIFSELQSILEEENPLPAIARLNDYRLLETIHPDLKLTNDTMLRMNSVKKVLVWFDLLFLEEPYMKWAVYFMALIKHCDQPAVVAICNRLELAQRVQTIFVRGRFKADRCLWQMGQNPPMINSALHELLADFKTEQILYMMAASGKQKIKKAISYYFTNLRYVKITVKGRDIKKTGVPPGPVYQKILKATLNAKLDGLLKTAQDERTFIQKYVKVQPLRDFPENNIPKL